MSTVLCVFVHVFILCVETTTVPRYCCIYIYVLCSKNASISSALLCVYRYVEPSLCFIEDPKV
jgi:hypothetical protein